MDDTDLSKDQYKAGQSGVIVYLESTDDEFIYKKWFSELRSKIVFSSVSSSKGNGGCSLVIRRVNDDDKDQSFGVVDRDVLLGRFHNKEGAEAELEGLENAWWNYNDNEFYNSSPLGSRVFILNRWELENYLLHPLVLKSICEDRTLGQLLLGEAADIAKKIIEHEEDLITVSCFSTLKNEGNGARFNNNSGHELKEKIKKVCEVSDERFDTDYHKIELFAENEKEPIIRWNKLSRMLDGKVIMGRVEKLLTGTENKCNLKQQRGFLAEKVLSLGLVDTQLKNWLASI